MIRKCGMLMYLDHLQKWFDFGLYWLNSGLLLAKKLNEFRVSGHSEKNAWKEWPEILVCKCTMTTYRTCLILAWFRHSVGQNFNEIGVSRHSKENEWKEWSEIWHSWVSWSPSELIRFWSNDFLTFCVLFDKINQMWGFNGFYGERMEGSPEKEEQMYIFDSLSSF